MVVRLRLQSGSGCGEGLVGMVWVVYQVFTESEI